MKRFAMIGAAVFSLSALLPAEAADNRLGLGAHYWKVVDSPDVRDIGRDGGSWFITYQRRVMPLLKWQADLEILPQEFAGSESEVFAPQLFAVVGGWVYGAIGTGILFSDGRFANRPFFNLRAGLDWKLLPRTRADLHVNYQFSEWRNINRSSDRRFESDAVFVGGAVRMEF